MKKYFNIDVVESLVCLTLFIIGLIYLSNIINMKDSFMSIEDMNIQTILFSRFHHFIGY